MNQSESGSSTPCRKKRKPGPHTALVARLAWLRFEDQTLAQLCPTSDLIFEGIIEPFDGPGWDDIDQAVKEGVRRGVDDFNTAPWTPRLHNKEPIFNAHFPAWLMGSNLTVSGFHAMRNDSRMAYDMTEIERMRCAIGVLSTLSSSLEKVGHILWLGWAPGAGPHAFQVLHDRIKKDSRDEALFGTQPIFPHDDFPDLARRMEKLALGVAADPASTPGRSLRV